MEVLGLSTFLLFNVIVCTHGSLYNPHVYPEYGPFFEGWYMRFTDTENARSFGVLFGKVLPEDEEASSNLVFLGLIYDDESTPSLVLHNAFPSVPNITTRGGHPVTEDPDVAHPAHFRWDAGHNGYIDVMPNATYIDVTVDGVHFQAKVGGSVPWDSGHEGPQGWLIRVPYIPLSWFVYSTRSPLISYTWHRLDSDDVISGTSGSVHMEKNWGKAFPSGWVWTQGVRTDNVSYAFAFGPLEFGLGSIPGHLGGYTNPAKSINISFRPDNSLITHTLKACSGDILVTVEMFTHKLTFHVSASLSTFSCLDGPTFNGFRKMCSESFKATAEVKVYKRRWLALQLIDSQSIYISALEFGGSFACNGGCS